MVSASETRSTAWTQFRIEALELWEHLPDKRVFFGLLVPWILLFHLLGNSTFGYVKTPSLFGWMYFVFTTSIDDQHGLLIPAVVLFLFWWKRKELLAVTKQPWWPAAGLVIFALILHIAGYMVQQTRVSILAFFIGWYGLMGWVWGKQWLKAVFFPMFLFGFCVPLGTEADAITFPLRVLATNITTVICKAILGIQVIQDGTRIFDVNQTFQYEVAAACSGLRSLTAVLALATIYSFVTFKTMWRCVLTIAAAFPLAIVSNVFRLTAIILTAEAFGQSAGNYIHESSFFSLLPYIPAIAGIMLVTYWLREREPAKIPMIATR